MFNTDLVNRARACLDIARASVRPYSHGSTAPQFLVNQALSALLAAGVGVQCADRIAVEEWQLPPTAWNRARNVAPRSMGCYDHRVAKRIPEVFRK